MAENPCIRSGEGRRRSAPAPADGRGLLVPRGHSVRVLARIRPSLPHEEEPLVPCLRPVGSAQLEVLQEPRALLTDATRSRRRTIGGLPNVGNCRSADTLSEAGRSGWWDVPSPLGLTGAAGLRSLESRTFSFDKVFDSLVTDDQVFVELEDELQAALEGEAVSILAYGATGSGKTHTVTNFAERAAKKLDEEAEALQQEGLRLDVIVQIVEIYNEQFRDLLVPDAAHHQEPPPRLKMSTPSSSATLQGASQRHISRESGMLRSLQAALRSGQAHRATCSTAVHGRSSRSHLVMMLYLLTCDASTGAQRRLGRLSLVDLAGSERIKSSEATGDRLREAQHINRSLSALADVIVAKEKNVAHVPYRNSKLTHLLQDALGGQQNSRTAIVVALPPTWSALGETLHSLQLSSRLNSIAAQKSRQPSLLWPPSATPEEEACALARLEAERLRLENTQMRARLLQLEEREKEREQELLELKEKVEARLLFQASESRRTFCSSPPSPVPEADSSQEKSFAESEKAGLPAETATSPTPEGLPELQERAEDSEELRLSRASLEARALDFTGSFAEVGFLESAPPPAEGGDARGSPSLGGGFLESAPPGSFAAAGFLESAPPPAEGGDASLSEGAEQNWKWTDPKETSTQLQFVPSPARSRRSTKTGEDAGGAVSPQTHVSAAANEALTGSSATIAVAEPPTLPSGGKIQAEVAKVPEVATLTLSAPSASKRPPSEAPAPRARSASCRSPREYIVEAISPAEVEQLTKSVTLPWAKPLLAGGSAVAPLPDTWLRDDDFITPQTEFVMLSEVQGLTDSEASPRSEGRISVSSDEAEIKDRLKALLRHRRPVMASYARVAGAGPAPQRSNGQPQGQAPRTARAGSAQTPRVAPAGHPTRTPRDRSVQAPARADIGAGPAARVVREGAQSHPRAATARTAPAKVAGPSRLTATRVPVSTAPAAPLPATPRSFRAQPTPDAKPTKTSPARAVSASPSALGGAHTVQMLAFSGIQRAPARHSLQTGRRQPASPMGSSTSGWNSDIRSPLSPHFAQPRTPRLRQPFAAPSLLSGARVVAGVRMNR